MFFHRLFSFENYCDFTPTNIVLLRESFDLTVPGTVCREAYELPLLIAEFISVGSLDG
jgi:hypothetical protein